MALIKKTFRVDEETTKKAEKIAKKMGLKLNAFVRLALFEMVEKNKRLLKDDD